MEDGRWRTFRGTSLDLFFLKEGPIINILSEVTLPNVVPFGSYDSYSWTVSFCFKASRPKNNENKSSKTNAKILLVSWPSRIKMSLGETKKVTLNSNVIKWWRHNMKSYALWLKVKKLLIKGTLLQLCLVNIKSILHGIITPS